MCIKNQDEKINKNRSDPRKTIYYYIDPLEEKVFFKNASTTQYPALSDCGRTTNNNNIGTYRADDDSTRQPVHR